ncbi:uncharacterized protein GGS22DRAFT_195086 [Annulohypoxylon maeteangense]|uniref:uncharacterized protein n=1 Tax=Annulohypoxylon maeteangense TaxID=1927788 RepID=UPI002007376A|nr:uncharacterized protein GGS22DRAFT_195086 [Annulohypoxylon maeteangense]KAI0883954.1 hypothetical protein GGS22DRAFT_195086 [Annulohypoxylon maeteangense]
MYHRNNTKFNCLDRRKSTSTRSVHLEHIRPEMAEHHAQAAAMQAFTRAKERSSVEATLWPPPRNNDSTDIDSYDGTPERGRTGSVIRRQQSVRFVRDRAPRSMEGCIATDNMTLDSNTNIMKARVGMDIIEPRPMASASAAGMASAAKGTAGDYINALFTGQEYYTPEDDFASAPSSYRKIRKSRSMFTCSEASVTSRNQVRTPTSAAVSQLPPSSVSSVNMGGEGSMRSVRLKAPKSMSFLRGRRDQPMLSFKRRGSVPISPIIDESAGYSGNKDKPTRYQPSSFLRSKSGNTDKFLRKSMRDISNDTILINGKIPKDGSLRNRARKVSNNFKHKLKSLFSLVKGDTDKEAFPPQQIEASKSHITDDDYMRINEFQFDSRSDDAAISRVPSGVPSLHAVPSYQQLRSRQGSVESLRSERRASDERSRVTSWSNSDTNTINTLSSRKGEWERQRLSVIKENGMHVSSSSARYPGVAHFANINTSPRSLPPPIPTQPATVNSQRIYSALMKRLNDTNKHSKEHELKKKKSVDDFISATVVPLRGSSQHYEGRGPNSPSTIRHVVSDGLSNTSSTRTIKRKPVASSRKVKPEPSKSPSHAEKSPTKPGIPSSKSMPIGDESSKAMDIDSWKTSIPRIEEPTPPARTLSTRSSAFFASPTCHLFRTKSPYRRALQDSIRTESQNTQLRSPEYNPWMRSLTGLQIRCPSTCDSEMDVKMQYAESVYSSTEDLGGSSINPSSAVDKFPNPPNNNHGDATIFLSPPVYRPTPPSITKHRVTSSTSSVEWKSWLSANVSKLEGTPDRVNAGALQYTVPRTIATTRSLGHVREKAQINGDEDEDDDQPHSSFHFPSNIEVYKPTRPEPDTALSTIEQNAIPILHTTPPTQTQTQATRPALQKKKSTSPILHDSNYKENEDPSRFTVTQIRNSLCATPSLGSMQSPSIRDANPASEPTVKGPFDSIRRKSLAHKASTNTLAGNSTHKLVRRQQGSNAKKYVTPTPSPGPKAAADKMGGSTGSRRRFMLATTRGAENVSPKDVEARNFSVDAEETDLGVGPQTMGSRKMVDLFLSSRRKRMTSDEEGNVFM